MPIYEYRRQDGTTFEVIQKFSDKPLTEDPETGEPVERVYSAPAIHFKGSGFHNTDYSSSRRARAGSSGDSGSGSGGDGESSSTSSDSSTKSDSPGDSGKSEAKPVGDSASSKTSSDD